MVKRREITNFGWKIKQRLVELKIDQREFCKRYNIPEARLSELITGKRPVKRYRKIVEKELNIQSSKEELAATEQTEYSNKNENLGQ